MIGVIYEVLSANVKWPAGLLLSDPQVAADSMKCSARMIGVIYEVLSANVKRPAGLLMI